MLLLLIGSEKREVAILNLTVFQREFSYSENANHVLLSIRQMKIATVIAMMLESWMRLSVYIKIMFLQCKFLTTDITCPIYASKFSYRSVCVYMSSLFVYFFFCAFPGWTLTTHQLVENL